MTAGARRLHPGDAFGLFRRSLGLRMVALTLSIGIVLIVLLTLVVSNLIRDDVFEDRSAAILSDAHQRVAAAQAELDNADTTTADQVAVATKNMVAKLGQISAASGAIGVVFLRASDETSTPVVNNMYTDPGLLGLVGDDLPELRWAALRTAAPALMKGASTGSRLPFPAPTAGRSPVSSSARASACRRPGATTSTSSTRSSPSSS